MQAYANGGIQAARAALPHRHERALYMKAGELGVRSPRKGIRRVRKYEPSEQIDAAIRRYYETCEDRPIVGRMKAFAKTLSRPAWWVKKRAAAMGLAVPSDKSPRWTPDEVALLEQHARKAIPVIRRIFKAHGFKRTEAAIGLQLKRGDYDRESTNHWTAHALAVLMGVDGHTITRWIDKEGLPAKRRGTNRVPEQGGDMYVIARPQLRQWIATHQRLVDLRKVDRFWFLDLAFGRAV